MVTRDVRGIPAWEKPAANPFMPVPVEKRLARLCRETDFGRIEGLEMRGGLPVMDESVVCRKTIRLDMDEKPASVNDAFIPSKEYQRLFRELRRLPDGALVSITIQNGTPKNMEVILKA